MGKNMAAPVGGFRRKYYNLYKRHALSKYLRYFYLGCVMIFILSFVILILGIQRGGSSFSGILYISIPIAGVTAAEARNLSGVMRHPNTGYIVGLRNMSYFILLLSGSVLFEIAFFGSEYLGFNSNHVLNIIGPAVSTPLEAVLSNFRLVLILEAYISTAIMIASARLARTPPRNSVLGTGLILVISTAALFFPLFNYTAQPFTSVFVVALSALLVGIPFAAIEVYMKRIRFANRIPAVILLFNTMLLCYFFPRSLFFLINNMFSEATLFGILGLVIECTVVYSLVLFGRAVSPPSAVRKTVSLLPLIIGGFLVLYGLDLLPTAGYLSIFQTFGSFLGNFFLASIVIAIMIVVSRVIRARGYKVSALFGFALFSSLFFMMNTVGPSDNRFQIPFLLGAAIVSSVLVFSDSLSIVMKTVALPGYDVMKTAKPLKRPSLKIPVKVTGKSRSSFQKRPVSQVPRRVPDMWVGTEISGYRITEIISRETGFAFVLKGSRQNEPDVAIKILKPYANDGTKIAFDNDFLRKFLVEFQNVMVLNDKKYVLHIIGVGLRTYPDDSTKMEKYQQNPPAIVMEFLGGGKLSDLDLGYGTKDEMEAFFEIAIRACQGLKDAHDNGILHGDIKPDNIMFWSRNGRSVKSYTQPVKGLVSAIRSDDLIPKIVDFGSAKVRGMGNVVFSQFSVLYSPPEVLINNYNTTETYDVYEFGLVMYYMLTRTMNDFGKARSYTKRQVFIESKVNTSSFYDNLGKLINDTSQIGIDKLSSINGMVDSTLEAVIMKCIDPDPSKRYRDMDELKKALIECARHSYGFLGVRDA